MRMRKKPNLKARMEKCGHLLVKEPELYRGRWLDFAYSIESGLGRDHKAVNGGDPFGELHVELGCGKGRFTVETAKAEEVEAEASAAAAESATNADAESASAGITAGTPAASTAASGRVLLVALEKSADAMIIALERAFAENLKNVLFVNAYADNLSDYFAPGEVSRIYLNFCDPWPSNRHAKRRLTNRRFLELYLQALRPGGEVHFKTDNLQLFDYSLKEFERAGLQVSGITRDLHKDGPVGVMTDYELKFHSQGSPIFRCTAQRDSTCSSSR